MSVDRLRDIETNKLFLLTWLEKFLQERELTKDTYVTSERNGELVMNIVGGEKWKLTLTRVHVPNDED